MWGPMSNGGPMWGPMSNWGSDVRSDVKWGGPMSGPMSNCRSDVGSDVKWGEFGCEVRLRPRKGSSNFAARIAEPLCTPQGKLQLGGADCQALV